MADSDIFPTAKNTITLEAGKMNEIPSDTDLLIYDDIPFGMVPRAIFEDDRLSPGSKALLSYMFTFRDRASGLCFPKEETLSESFDVDVRTIRRWLRELINTQWLIKGKARKQYALWKGHPNANCYLLRNKSSSMKDKYPTGHLCPVEGDMDVRFNRTQESIKHTKEHTKQQSVVEDTSEEKEQILSELKVLGISETKAKELIQSHSELDLLNGIEIAHQGRQKNKIDDIAAWLVWWFMGNRKIPKWFKPDPNSESERRKYLEGVL